MGNVGVFEVLAQGYGEMRKRTRVLESKRSGQDEQMRGTIPESDRSVRVKRDEQALRLTMI